MTLLFKRNLLFVKRWFWAYSSFLLPFILYFLITRASPWIALRAGLIGFSLAIIIYSIWKVSLRMHGIVLPEKHSSFFVLLSGVLLWIVWFAVAQTILITIDEITIH